MAADNKTVSGSSFVRRSGEPVWSQIARSIEEQIISGNMPSGTRLPTENQLAASFGVNRHTLRRALRELVRKGLITATPRRGTIVTRRRFGYPLCASLSLSAVARATGMGAEDRLLRHSIVRATRNAASALQIADRSMVLDLHYLRLLNNVPVCLSECWMPADRFEGVGRLFERLGSLERALSELNVALHDDELRIIGQPATEQERRHLDLPKGATVLIIDRRYMSEGGDPVLAIHNCFAADLVELRKVLADT